jgi:large subunit ribosomal protein L24
MHVKKGDKVIVLVGKDRGKTGVVTRSFPQQNRVVVEGLNMAKKHRKGKDVGIIDVEMPLHASNVKKVEK